MRRPSVVSFLSDAMLQPPAGLHCTAAHYRTRRNLFRVASTVQTTHTHTLPRARSILPRSVGSSFKLRSPSLDRDPILELKTMMIAIVAIYGVALTTRFAEGDVDVDVVADTRFFPPRRGAFLAVSCPPVGVLFQDSCANKFPPPARRFLPIFDRLSRVNVILVCCSLLQFPSSSKRCPQR